MLHDRAMKTGWHAVAAGETLFEVSGRDRQCVAFPLSKRKALPSSERILRRARASVQIDQSLAGHFAEQHAITNDFPRERILFFQNRDRVRTQLLVTGRVRPALENL